MKSIKLLILPKSLFFLRLIIQTFNSLFLIGNPEDNKWLSEQLSHTLVYDRLYEYGHFSFFIANKMSYLSDLRDVLKSYHPVQIPSISDSDFYAIENSDDDVISY